MNSERHSLRADSLLLLTVALLLSSAAQARVKVGSILPYSSETPHPYAAGTQERPVVWQERVMSRGASLLRIHFVEFSLAPGDYLTISAGDGSDEQRYEAAGLHSDGEFWSFTVDSDEAMLALHAGTTTAYGYRIDAIARGELALEDTGEPPADKPDCKSGYENVACHNDNPQFWNGQQAVAKINFMENGNMYVGTGWLVVGSDKNTFITNAHNLNDDKVARTADVTFNYQTPMCTGGNPGRDRYAVFKVLERNDSNDYDYTVVKLLGNVEEKWKPLRASTKDIRRDGDIWVPQHPGGEVKQVGWFLDNAHQTLCTVSGFRNPNDVLLMCAAVPGSSGSPVLDANVATESAMPDAIGLITRAKKSALCPTVAIKMSAICADDARNKKVLVCSK